MGYLLHPRTDYELASTLLAQGKTYKEVAAELDINPETLRQGLRRRGVTAVAVRAAAYVPPSNQSRTAKLAADASKLLKASLGSTLAKHAAALDKVPVKPNLQHIKDFGEAIEPLARTGKIVHDWGNDEPQTLVQIGLVGHWDSAADAIEVQSSATIGSVEQPITETPPGPDSTSG